MIFCGVTGIDEREASSPSFFNIAEVEVLMDYVKKLLQTHGKKGLATISPSDIGIIAPYRKQVIINSGVHGTQDNCYCGFLLYKSTLTEIKSWSYFFLFGCFTGAENPQGSRQGWEKP